MSDPDLQLPPQAKPSKLCSPHPARPELGLARVSNGPQCRELIVTNSVAMARVNVGPKSSDKLERFIPHELLREVERRQDTHFAFVPYVPGGDERFRVLHRTGHTDHELPLPHISHQGWPDPDSIDHAHTATKTVTVGIDAGQLYDLAQALGETTLKLTIPVTEQLWPMTVEPLHEPERGRGLLARCTFDGGPETTIESEPTEDPR